MKAHSRQPDPVSFRVSKRDAALIERIAKRAREMGIAPDSLTTVMDLSACHSLDNGNVRLDLRRLLKADDFNFTHDIVGINRHLNRETGKLKNCFCPRITLNRTPLKRRS